MKIPYILLTLITVILTTSLSADVYIESSGQIEFENQINYSMDKILKKALTSGLSMDDVYLSIPENVNNIELKAYLRAYAEKFKGLVKELWVQYGLIVRDESYYKEVPHRKYFDEESNKAHINYQKEWWENLEAKAKYRATGGGSGASVRYDSAIIEECIDRIIELKPSLK